MKWFPHREFVALALFVWIAPAAGCDSATAVDPDGGTGEQADMGPGDLDGPGPGDLDSAPRPDSRVDLSLPPDLSADAAPVESGVTTLRVHYPAGAHSLAVRGDQPPLSWDAGLAMTPGANDTWTYTVTLPSSTARLEWKPLLDDSTWSRGPNYVALRGQTVDVYPHFFTQKGTVSKLLDPFYSSLLENDRVVWVYLPASYNENTCATYPVLYLQDGQNVFNAGVLGSGGWRADETLDAAGEDGSIRELIVVAPEHAGVKREWEYTPTYDATEQDGGGGDLYLRLLVEELKPQVDAMLRTRPGRATTGILGSSLGGLLAAYAGIAQADTFGLVGVMSPSTWWDDKVIVGWVQGMTQPRPDRVYVDYGDTDDGGDDTSLLVAAYLQTGYTEGVDFHSYVQPGGQHSEYYWALRLPGALQFLFGPRIP